MNARDLCRATYKEFIRTTPGIPEDLRKALKTHERVPAFIDNLSREIGQLEQAHHFHAKLRGKPVTKKEIIGLVEDLTAHFIKNVVRQAKERAMSDAEKQRILAAHSEAKAMDTLVEESLTDEQIETKGALSTERSTHKIQD